MTRLTLAEWEVVEVFFAAVAFISVEIGLALAGSIAIAREANRARWITVTG